ncbi:hypothetical protein ACFWUZ_30125 [Streptomyces sp. NPDC058646]|uniref:hypothetical protein n=1 Tax=Streptomyces sp. NPDC058646 TaxID=3346574 RepID=UPI0036462971
MTARRGADWTPLDPGEIHTIRPAVSALTAPGAARFGIRVHADALPRLGLHPGQTNAKVIGVSPPGRWHAAAERTSRRRL